MTDNIVVKDANGISRTMKTTDNGGVHISHSILSVGDAPVSSGNPLPVAGTISGYDAQDDMIKVKSVQKKFRDSFSEGSVLNAAKWDSTVGAGMTMTQANNVLTISTGTTADSETVLLSKEVFSIPFRSMAGFMASQRIGRQTAYIEIVSVDPVTLQPDNRWSAGWRYSGVNNTYGVYEVKSGATSGKLMSAPQTVNSTGSYAIAEIEPFADEAWFHSRVIDSANGRTQSFVRHQQIPEADQLYKLRIRIVNKGVLSITGCASGTGSVVRLTVTSHGLTTGNKVNVANVNGVAAANGSNFTITVVDAHTIELNGTVFSGTFVNDGYAYLETTNTAPASNTNIDFQFVNVVDYAELTAEITAGRGSTAAGQAISVIGAGGSISLSNAIQNTAGVTLLAGNYASLSSTNLAANATYNSPVLTAYSAAYTNMQWAYLRVDVLHNAGVAAQHGTLFIETYDTTSTTTPTSGQRVTYSVPVPSDDMVHTYLFPVPTKYFRINFKNGGTGTQTAFNLSYATLAPGAGSLDQEDNIPFLLSTTNLGASATFTSASFDLGVSRRYKNVTLVSNSAQSGKLALEQSHDGTTWFRTHSFAVAANEVAFKDRISLVMRYSRVVYINDAVAQTSFSLSATLGV